MKPYDTSPAFVDEVLAKTTRRMAELGFLWGSAERVAAQLQEYVDAGVDWICPADYLPIVLDPADAAGSLPRTIEVCERLKAV
jgi:phthiodiolone/phenolphthiodiolone dimycocerosates ketoreductase